MLCTKSVFDSLMNTCPDCASKFIVMADTGYLDTRYFCFKTYDEARAAYDVIENTNEYAGMKFIPKTAILLKPREV